MLRDAHKDVTRSCGAFSVKTMKYKRQNVLLEGSMAGMLGTASSSQLVSLVAE